MAKVRGAGNFYVGAANDTYGTITSCTENDAADIVPSFDEDGEADGVDSTNRVITLTMELQTSATLPEAGATVSCKFEDGTTANAIIESVDKTETNNEWKTASITAKYYPTNGIPS